jgi:hypothetical protein
VSPAPVVSATAATAEVEQALTLTRSAVSGAPEAHESSVESASMPVGMWTGSAAADRAVPTTGVTDWLRGDELTSADQRDTLASPLTSSVKAPNDCADSIGNDRSVRSSSCAPPPTASCAIDCDPFARFAPTSASADFGRVLVFNVDFAFAFAFAFAFEFVDTWKPGAVSGPRVVVCRSAVVARARTLRSAESALFSAEIRA